MDVDLNVDVDVDVDVDVYVDTDVDFIVVGAPWMGTPREIKRSKKPFLSR